MTAFTYAALCALMFDLATRELDKPGWQKWIWTLVYAGMATTFGVALFMEML